MNMNQFDVIRAKYLADVARLEAEEQSIQAQINVLKATQKQNQAKLQDLEFSYQAYLQQLANQERIEKPTEQEVVEND